MVNKAETRICIDTKQMDFFLQFSVLKKIQKITSHKKSIPKKWYDEGFFCIYPAHNSTEPLANTFTQQLFHVLT